MSYKGRKIEEKSHHSVYGSWMNFWRQLQDLFAGDLCYPSPLVRGRCQIDPGMCYARVSIPKELSNRGGRLT
jgi:hypothetical protein